MARIPPPSPFPPPQRGGLRLTPPRLTGEFVDVLRTRRTWRGFGSEPIPKSRLASLLALSFGASMQGVTNAGVTILFKSSPSAGGLHPTQAYVLAVNVAGVPPGLYRYGSDTGTLHRISRGASASKLVTYLSGQWWYSGAGALILMTSRVDRVWYTYPHARAYRSLLLDAGHVCQTLCLVATWLGLAPFCTQALADSLIERDLRIDGTTEIVLYAAGVGTKPRNGRWVQWPAHDPASPYLPARKGGPSRPATTAGNRTRGPGRRAK